MSSSSAKSHPPLANDAYFGKSVLISLLLLSLFLNANAFSLTLPRADGIDAFVPESSPFVDDEAFEPLETVNGALGLPPLNETVFANLTTQLLLNSSFTRFPKLLFFIVFSTIFLNHH